MAKLETATYAVSRDIALRSGMLDSRYRTADGRYILNDRDLSRVYLSPDEYVSGLRGVERVTPEEADSLIEAGGYRMGDEGLAETQETSEPGINDENNWEDGK